jgi:hypothetical protein
MLPKKTFLLLLGVYFIFTLFYGSALYINSNKSTSAQVGSCYVCGEDGYWRGSGQTCDNSSPQCEFNNEETFEGCFGGNTKDVCAYPPSNVKLLSSTVPNASDIHPLSRLEYCRTGTNNDPDIGAPVKSCVVGQNGERFEGHSYLRYAGEDETGHLYCQRSLCIDDTTLKPFEFPCSNADAPSPATPQIGTPHECRDEQGNLGVNFYRYSFTASDGQNYCYLSVCQSSDVALGKTGLETKTVSNPTTNFISTTQRDIENLSESFLPEGVNDEREAKADEYVKAAPDFFKPLTGLVNQAGNFFSKSDGLQHTFLPEGVAEKKSNDFGSFLSGIFGNKSKVGIFTDALPEGVDKCGETEGFRIGPFVLPGTKASSDKVSCYFKINYPEGTRQ